MKIFLLSLLICFNSFCQDSTKLSRQYFTAGAISLTASILPYYVAHTTYINNKNNHYSYLFVGVWVSFGVVLDINSIHCFKKSCELRKKNNF
jgi:hypothetical protein